MILAVKPPFFSFAFFWLFFFVACSLQSKISIPVMLQYKTESCPMSVGGESTAANSALFFFTLKSGHFFPQAEETQTRAFNP